MHTHAHDLFFSFLIMHTHRISLRSFGTTSASIVHATSVHHPSHQCPRLSISTPGNWRPCPPPAHTSPYFRLSLPLASSPLHQRPFLFWTPTPLSIGAHRSADHRLPYCFVANKGNVLHSIWMLCFPGPGRRHPHVLPACSNICTLHGHHDQSPFYPWRSPCAPLIRFSLPYRWKAVELFVETGRGKILFSFNFWYIFFVLIWWL